jgi:hypothetical protein
MSKEFAFPTSKESSYKISNVDRQSEGKKPAKNIVYKQ